MNTKSFVIFLLAVVVLIGGFFLIGRDGDVPEEIEEVEENGNDIVEPGPEPTEAEKVLDRLPHTVTESDRTVVIDKETVDQTEREEYSFREAGTLPKEDEDPVDYIERILRIRLIQPHVIADYELYNYTVSAYPFNNNGVSVFVRLSDIPDDAIGEEEERFDLVLTDGKWVLDWYGRRHFCRRPDQEFWAPADELCP